MDVIPLPSKPSRGPVLPRWSEDHRVSGEPPAGDRAPEDWAASTTTLAGEESLGLTTLLGGRFLKAAIEDGMEQSGDQQTAHPIHHRLAAGVHDRLMHAAAGAVVEPWWSWSVCHSSKCW